MATEASINAVIREVMEAEVNEHGLTAKHFYMSTDDGLPVHVLMLRPIEYRPDTFSFYYNMGDDDVLPLDPEELVAYLFGVMEYLVGIYEGAIDWTNDDDA
jgi:hypothetical protein